jgi:hypothetical protein
MAINFIRVSPTGSILGTQLLTHDEELQNTLLEARMYDNPDLRHQHVFECCLSSIVATRYVDSSHRNRTELTACRRSTHPSVSLCHICAGRKPSWNINGRRRCHSSKRSLLIHWLSSRPLIFTVSDPALFCVLISVSALDRFDDVVVGGEDLGVHL